jgi:hypothetical protein
MGICKLGVPMDKYNDEVSNPLRFTKAANSTTSVKI